MKPFAVRTAVLLLAVAAALPCRDAAAQVAAPVEPPPPLIQPGAPGKPSATIDVARATDLSKVGFTAADVQFMQGMIGHHAQAVEMVDLLKTRTASDEMKKLGERIAVSQIDEIGMMKEWLQKHGQEIPNEHAHHMHGAKLMPGMLTAEDMARLTAAKGAEFDRLFLEYMIKHHQGAIVMVQDLFASPGAGQDGDIFAFASDVDADQAMEIRRMAIMLKELQK